MAAVRERGGDIPMSMTWFITGASGGFGRELAELLFERGHWVAATVRKQEALQDLAAKYGEGQKMLAQSTDVDS